MKAARDADGAGRVAIERARLCLLVDAPTTGLRDLPDRARRAIEAAEAVGAPALPALDAALEAVTDDRERSRAVAVATSQARTVATGLAVLPFVVVPVLGWLLGADLWRFYGSPTGRIVAGLGLTLALAGAVLARWLTRRVIAGHDNDLTDDEVADLLATVLTAGLPPGEACRVVATVLPWHGEHLRAAGLALDHARPVAGTGAAPAIAVLMHAAAPLGAPIAPALRRHARDLRGQSRADALAAVERLPALLTFPTTLCSLPACLLLVVAPLVVDGLAAAGIGP